MTARPAPIEMQSVPLGYGLVALECSECGPLETTLATESRATLLRHLATEHKQGAPA